MTLQVHVLSDLFDPIHLAALDPLEGQDVKVPGNPLDGTIADLAMKVPRKRLTGKAALRASVKGGGMYQGQ